MNEIKKNWKKWISCFAFAVAVIVVYKVLDNFGEIQNVISRFLGIIAPFLSGILIAYLLYIPSSKIERGLLKSKSKFIRKKARAISVFTTYLIAVILLIILINVIIPIVIDSFVELANNFQGYFEKTMKAYNELPEESILKSEVITDILEEAKNIDLKKFINTENIQMYISGAFGVATSVIDIFVTIVVSVYILLERNQILQFGRKLSFAILEEKTCIKLEKYFNSSNQIFIKFVSSQLIDAVIIGILTTIAMSIIGVKYAVLLGFIIGLFNIIPYFGAIVAVAISILITVITGGLSQAIIMTIVVVILQQIDANIINPKIIGNSLKISPLLVIFAVTVGGAYFGVIGMFLAVPVIAVLKIVVNDFINHKNKTKIINKTIE